MPDAETNQPTKAQAAAAEMLDRLRQRASPSRNLVPFTFVLDEDEDEIVRAALKVIGDFHATANTVQAIVIGLTGYAAGLG